MCDKSINYTEILFKRFSRLYIIDNRKIGLEIHLA